MMDSLTIDELIQFAEFLSRTEVNAHLDKFGLDIKSEKVPLASFDSLAAKRRIIDKLNDVAGEAWGDDD